MTLATELGPATDVLSMILVEMLGTIERHPFVFGILCVVIAIITIGFLFYKCCFSGHRRADHDENYHRWSLSGSMKEEGGLYSTNAKIPEASYEKIQRHSLPPVPYKLNTFLKVTIPKLHHQSKTPTGQFAVLFLGKKNSDADYELKLGGNCTKFTDPSQVSYPDDKYLGNYIVARHDAKDEHAEKFLLDRFKPLQDTYVGENNNCLPSFVLIYSWCMPCGACTRDIIKMKKEMTKEIEVTVIYRIKYDDNKDPKNQQMLKDEGINVYQDKNYLKRS